MNVRRVIPLGLVAVGSVVRFRHNRRQRLLQECQAIFGCQPTGQLLTKRQWRRVDNVIAQRREQCRRARRLYLVYSQARPAAARKYQDELYAAQYGYDRALWHKEHTWRY